MESLVKKLKGTINDPSLRKINEVAIKFKVNKMNTSSVGSNNYKVKLVIATSVNVALRSPNNISISPSGEEKTFYLSNIQDGDCVYIEDSKNCNTIRIDGVSTSAGFKPIEFSFEGLHKENIQEILFNGVSGDLSTMPGSTFVKRITISATKNNSPYFTEFDVDLKDLYEKYPNTQSFILHDINARLTNIAYLKKFNDLSTVQIYSLDKYVEDIDVSYFENIISANIYNVEAHGDYFGLLDGAERIIFSFSGTFQYNGETFEGSKFSQIGGENFFVIGDVDTMLNNMANNATRASSGGNNTIRISSYRTSASDSAIQKLQSKGWTVSIPIVETLSANTLSSINTMSLINSEENAKLKKYRIAYQGKEIIITPTEFPIYPADGVTVKEFQTLEEANQFINENNLSTEVE